MHSRTPKGSNRRNIVLRQAANVIGRLKDTHLSNFFNRMAYRKGRASAISATARKLAVILWNMVVKEIPYNNEHNYLFLDQKRKMGLLKRIRKQIDKFDLNSEELGFTTSSLSAT